MADSPLSPASGRGGGLRRGRGKGKGRGKVPLLLEEDPVAGVEASGRAEQDERSWLLLPLRPGRATVEKWLEVWWRRWMVLVGVPCLSVRVSERSHSLGLGAHFSSLPPFLPLLTLLLLLLLQPAHARRPCPPNPRTNAGLVLVRHSLPRLGPLRRNTPLERASTLASSSSCILYLLFRLGSPTLSLSGIRDELEGANSGRGRIRRVGRSARGGGRQAGD